MFRFSLVLCVAFFAFSASAQQAAQQPKCNELIKEAETGMKELLFSANSKFPHTKQEYAVYGQHAIKAYNIMKSYRNCNRGFARQVYNMVYKGVSRTLKEMYGKEANVTKILHQIRCFDDKLKPKFQNCINSLAHNVKYVSQNIPDAEQFPGSCCSARMGLECVVKEIRGHCTEGKEDGVEFVKSLVKNILGDLWEFACNDYTSFQICEEKNPQLVQKLKDNVKKQKPPPEEFIIRPLLEIAKRRISSE